MKWSNIASNMCLYIQYSLSWQSKMHFGSNKLNYQQIVEAKETNKEWGCSVNLDEESNYRLENCLVSK